MLWWLILEAGGSSWRLEAHPGDMEAHPEAAHTPLQSCWLTLELLAHPH
jgi:hypothetical protein